MKWNMVPLLVLAGLAGAIATFPARAEENKSGQKEPVLLHIYAGEITEIGQVDRTITVRKFPLKKMFQVSIDCAIATVDKPKATLKDLKVGDKVKVKYEEAQDGLVARSIVIRGIDAEDREDAREQERLERH